MLSDEEDTLLAKPHDETGKRENGKTGTQVQEAALNLFSSFIILTSTLIRGTVFSRYEAAAFMHCSIK